MTAFAKNVLNIQVIRIGRNLVSKWFILLISFFPLIVY